MVDWDGVWISIKVLLFMGLVVLVLYIAAGYMTKLCPMPEDKFQEGFDAGYGTHNETIDNYATKYCEYATTVCGMDDGAYPNFDYYKGYHKGYVKWYVEKGEKV